MTTPFAYSRGASRTSEFPIVSKRTPDAQGMILGVAGAHLETLPFFRGPEQKGHRVTIDSPTGNRHRRGHRLDQPETHTIATAFSCGLRRPHLGIAPSLDLPTTTPPRPRFQPANTTTRIPANPVPLARDVSPPAIAPTATPHQCPTLHPATHQESPVRLLLFNTESSPNPFTPSESLGGSGALASSEPQGKLAPLTS
jgi:hypothetical protein